MSPVPILETDRLILREVRRTDLDAHAGTLGDGEVMRHIGGDPVSREDSWRRLLMSVGMWSVIGMGPWVVERREDGRYLGHIGFFDFEREGVLVLSQEHALPTTCNNRCGDILPIPPPGATL